MGLFDVIDEIAEKQVMKTETGDNRIFGVMTGVVAKNYDRQMPGRVCVTIPVRDQEANELQWARMAMPSSGKKWGHYFLPEVGDQVLLAFEQGNIEKPYVIGCVPKDTSRFLAGASDEQNQFKKIMTKNGNAIIFEDNPVGEGDNDKIQIVTAKETHSVSLDNERKQISLGDKAGKNQVVMNTETGHMKIKAETKLVIEVGENIKMTLNGNNGAVQIECNKFTVNASGNVKMEASGILDLSGNNASLEAASIAKVKSSGPIMLEGAPVKLG